MNYCYRLLLVAMVGFFASGSSALAQPAEPLQLKRCVVCHTSDRICLNLGKDLVFWKGTIERMSLMGAKVSNEEIPGFSRLLNGEESLKAVGDVLDCVSLDKNINKPEGLGMPVAVGLVHPLFMTFALLLSLLVAKEGLNRARISLFRHKVAFNWKGHVKHGSIVMGIWFFGLFAGGIMTRLIFGSFGATGDHRLVALTMLPMIIFGAGSGLYMHFAKKPRKILPILHGTNNLMLVVLTFMQFITGVYLVRALFV